MMQSIDLTIIGAGPAGISTALHLVQLDQSWADRLVVLEKDRHPRHKVCGGGITRFGLDQLMDLGLHLEIPFVPIHIAEIRYRKRNMLFHGRPIFAVTRRSELDAWLAQKAREEGIQILEESPVRNLSRTEGGLRVESDRREISTRAIVGADGSLGIVRHWLQKDDAKAQVARLIELITRASGEEREYQERTASFDFSRADKDLQGYYWDFPSLIQGEPNMNSGVYDSRIARRKPRAKLLPILNDGLSRRNEKVERNRLEGHPIHLFSPSNIFSKRRVLLVGDAAGADPLFGEGISIALAYGSLAAKSIHRAFRDGNFSFRRYKGQILSSRLGRYLLLRWMFASVVYPLASTRIVMEGIWRIGALLGSLLNSKREHEATLLSQHIYSPEALKEPSRTK